MMDDRCSVPALMESLHPDHRFLNTKLRRDFLTIAFLLQLRA